MGIVLPAITFILLIRCFLQKSEGLRDAVLKSAVIMGVTITLTTEILSLLNCVTDIAFASAWMIIALTLLYLSRPSGYSLRLKVLDNVDKIILAGILLAILPTLYSALVSPPNNIDSLEYHMPRVAHWIQNETAAHFPTNDPRQLNSPPLAEYGILHLWLLWGDDQLCNMVQWFAMLLCVIGTTALAARFNAGRLAQLSTAAITATIPMGILQATNTQTDYTVTLWLLSMVYFLYTYSQKRDTLSACMVGLSLGLAILTKGTSFVFAAPFILYVMIAFMRNYKTMYKHMILATLLVAVMCAGFFSRNISTFNDPLGKIGLHGLNNELYTAPAIASIIIRNVGIHAKVNFSNSINPKLYDLIEKLHEWLGIDMNDTRTRWKHIFTCEAFEWDYWHEDFSGSPLHALLAALAFPACIVLWFTNKKKYWPALALIAGVGYGFLLFCILFKWSPYHVRHHLTLFVLAAPCVGIMLEQAKNRRIAAFVIIILSLLSVPVNLFNVKKPMLGPVNVFNSTRMELYWVDMRGNIEAVRIPAQIIKDNGFTDIGLYIGPAEEEYLYWVFPKMLGHKNFRIHNMRTEHRDTAKVYIKVPPRVPILLSNIRNPSGMLIIGDTVYRRPEGYKFGNKVSVYFPEE